MIKSQNIKVKPYLLIYTSFFGQKQKSPILYLKIVISWVVYPEGFSRVPDPNHKFWIQIHNTIFVSKEIMFDQRSYIWTFSMGKCLNMPKVWVQSWGSFPLALAAEIVPKKLNEMTHSKNLVYWYQQYMLKQTMSKCNYFHFILILLLYKNSSEKLQYLILKF